MKYTKSEFILFLFLFFYVISICNVSPSIADTESQENIKSTPHIESISPAPYMPGRTIFTIKGSGFKEGAYVKIDSPSYKFAVVCGSNSVEVISDKEIKLHIKGKNNKRNVHGPGGGGATFAIENHNGNQSNEFDIAARPLTMHLVFHTHLDIGFNGTPSEIAQRYKRFFDDVTKMIENDNTSDENTKVRFTVETIWQLEQYIKRSSQSEIDKFFDFVRDGRIEICAGYNTPNTSALSYEDLGRLFYPAAEYRKKYNIPIKTLIFNDQPGYTWSVADIAVASGINYFLTGVNMWKGNAMPETPFPVGHRPFYWVGRTGDKLLTWPSIGEIDKGKQPWKQESYKWIHGGAYPEAITTYKMIAIDPIIGRKSDNPMVDAEHLEARVLDGLAYLADRDYPYEHLLVMGASGDNDWGGGELGPMAKLGLRNFDKFRMMRDAASILNADNDSFQVKITTPTPFFETMMKCYGDFPEIPSVNDKHGGDWPSCWETADAASSRCMKMLRALREKTPALEKLAVLKGILCDTDSYPSAEFNEIWRLIRIWDGHTSPGFSIHTEKDNVLTWEQVYKHAAEYVQFISDADSIADRIEKRETGEIAGCLADDKNARIAVFNQTGWNRSDIVSVNISDDSDFNIIDLHSGKPVLWQHANGDKNKILFFAEDVPQNGYRLFEIVHGEPVSDLESSLNVNIDNRRLENEYYRITLDNDGYPIEIFDKAIETDIIDHNTPFRFLALLGINRNAAGVNGFHLGSVPHYEPTANSCHVHIGEHGPAIASLVVERPGAPNLKTEIRLYQEIKKVDFIMAINTDAIEPVEYMNSFGTYWFIPFTFNLDNRKLQTALDTASGFLNPFRDTIPGAFNDLMFTLHGLVLADDSMHIELGCPENFIWDFPTSDGTVGHVGGAVNGLEKPPFASIFSIFYSNNKPHLMTYKNGPDIPGDMNPALKGYQAYPISKEPGLEGPLSLNFTLRSGENADYSIIQSAQFLGNVNNPMIAFFIEPSELTANKPPYTASLVKSNMPHVEIIGIKLAQDENSQIVRLREVAGIGGVVNVSSDLFNILSAQRVNLVEETFEETPKIDIINGAIILNIRPYEQIAIQILEIN